MRRQLVLNINLSGLRPGRFVSHVADQAVGKPARDQLGFLGQEAIVEVHVAGLDHRRRRVIVNHAVVVENIRIGNDDISCRRLRRDMRKAIVEAAEKLLEAMIKECPSN